MNQDNFICAGKYMESVQESGEFQVTGSISSSESGTLGIFDGMGGEECGEIASYIAAEEAAHMVLTERPVQDLLAFCKKANEKICRYAEKNKIHAMGTTAALLGFARNEIALCNIGDSKIFRFAQRKLEQISVDHISTAVYGRKPCLSQNLGISPTEMIIDPYAAHGRYNSGDVFLICSDGLTDMLTQGEILKILIESEADRTAGRLLEMALARGGRDNITIILCRIKREKLSDRIFRRKNRGSEQ